MLSLPPSLPLSLIISLLNSIFHFFHKNGFFLLLLTTLALALALHLMLCKVNEHLLERSLTNSVILELELLSILFKNSKHFREEKVVLRESELNSPIEAM
jgi:hypothetical protein